MGEREWFSQPNRVRFDWGWGGSREAAERGDAIVIVDVLRFSTAVSAAVARGIEIVPAGDADDLDQLATRFAARRIDDALRPATYDRIDQGSRVLVRSPNGATCVRLASVAPTVLIGAIVNASAVARHLQHLIDSTRQVVTVIACGERWHEPREDGPLRFAIEDYLGASAILSKLTADLSAEARTCAAAFEANRSHLAELVLTCGSGRELIDKDDRASAEFAARPDSIDVVPMLRDGRLTAGFNPLGFAVQPARQ